MTEQEFSAPDLSSFTSMISSIGSFLLFVLEVFVLLKDWCGMTVF